MRTKSPRVCAFLALIVLCHLLWQPVTAQAVTFDFRSALNAPPTEYFVPGLTQFQDWVGVTATASWPRFLNQDQDGLGVTGGPALPGDDTQVDGNNPAEMIQLQFTQNVLLQSIVFTRIDSSAPGDWAMAFVDTSIVYFSPLPGGNASDTGTYTLDLSGMATNLRTGSVVKLAAFFPTDDFKVAAVTVDRAPGAPLPSSFTAGLLMLAVMGGSAMLRRPTRATA